MSSRRLLRRGWLYFRTGHGVYWFYLMSFAQWITIIYVLLISNINPMKALFPTIYIFMIIFVAIYLPTSILTGYLHFKRTGFFQAEMDINIESNPYYYVVPPGYNRHVLIPAGLLTLQVLKRIAEREGMLSPEEKQLIEELEKKYKILWKGGKVNG